MSKKVVVLLSGGLDSTTVASLARTKHTGHEVLGLTLSYGQRHHKEIQHAARVAEYLNIDFTVLDVPLVLENSGSILLRQGVEIPRKSYEEIDGVSPMYVPFRNALMISYATAIALEHEASYVYFGAHSEDALNWAYPDCTPEFIGSMSSAVYVGTYHKVRLITPLQWLTKTQVVEVALDIDAPLHLTWSCYDGKEKACGECATCVSRINAFKELGKKDPVDYKISIDWAQ